MSKHPMVPNIHFVASSRTNCGRLLSLTALLLGGLTVPASAQNQPVARVAPEKHFTIPPDVPTPMVFMTEPGAACDLHATGVNDPSYTMRLYANIEGYVRFHFTPNQGIVDAYLQLDCATPLAVTTHPLYLRIAASATEDMPAPAASVPLPAGSKIRPALTDEAARQMSDEDLIARGYPPRPNAAESPEAYAKWLGRASRPMTILPPHAVSRSDISHLPRTGFAGPETSKNWSGLVAQSTPGTYLMVGGQWIVPSVTGEVATGGGRPRPGPPTYSALWVGLDGNTTNDLIQAGTEQDARSLLPYGTATDYYAWTEVFPQEPIVEAFGVSPGDNIFAWVFVGDSQGYSDPSGGYAWFSISDSELGVQQVFSTKLGPDVSFSGNSAEWIMERPYITALSGFPELADYNTCQILASVWENATGGWRSINYSSAQNQQDTMYEWFDVQPDNNELSTVSAVSGHPSSIQFSWKSFH
jgi:Peptidase A4 family